MFKINNFEDSIIIEEFENSKIFIIDNFYVDSYRILNFINSVNLLLHKKHASPSYNGIHFWDENPVTELIHHEDRKQLFEVKEKLSKLCNQEPIDENLFLVNSLRFIKNNFNDYKNNYWWPHFDRGYSSLIYFNEGNFNGTHLYKQIEDDNIKNVPEHYAPWRKKTKFKVIKTIESKFNRMVLFDGKFFLHGMAVEDDRFFQREKRINQVYFFLQVHY